MAALQGAGPVRRHGRPTNGTQNASLRPRRLESHRARSLLVGLVASLLALSAVPAAGQYGAANGEWRSYGGDLGSTKYSPLDQIDATNFNDLQLAWRWKSADGSLDLKGLRATLPQLGIGMFQATPLMVDGTLYLSTALQQVAAVDAASGETIWVHDPEVYLKGLPAHFYNSRGVAYRGRCELDRCCRRP